MLSYHMADAYSRLVMPAKMQDFLSDPLLRVCSSYLIRVHQHKRYALFGGASVFVANVVLLRSI